MSWSDAEKGPFMCAVVRLVRGHSITVGKLPVDFRMKVGERGTTIHVELSYACLVWSSVRLRRVIGEIVGEQFVEDVKSSLCLDLFGIPAEFVIIGGSDAGISAALRAHELDRKGVITVALADGYPNFSICGLPLFLCGETPDWHYLAQDIKRSLTPR